MRILLVLLAASAALSLFGCASLLDSEVDNELSRNVRAAINTDPRLEASDITIVADMESGEVRLSGEVSISELIVLAVELAEGVEGVESIINQLTLQEMDSGMTQEHVGTPAGTALGF